MSNDDTAQTEATRGVIVSSGGGGGQPKDGMQIRVKEGKDAALGTLCNASSSGVISSSRPASNDGGTKSNHQQEENWAEFLAKIIPTRVNGQLEMEALHTFNLWGPPFQNWNQSVTIHFLQLFRSS